jgi:hypothetical protein
MRAEIREHPEPPVDMNGGAQLEARRIPARKVVEHVGREERERAGDVGARRLRMRDAGERREYESHDDHCTLHSHHLA